MKHFAGFICLIIAFLCAVMVSEFVRDSREDMQPIERGCYFWIALSAFFLFWAIHLSR